MLYDIQVGSSQTVLDLKKGSLTDVVLEQDTDGKSFWKRLASGGIFRRERRQDVAEPALKLSSVVGIEYLEKSPHKIKGIAYVRSGLQVKPIPFLIQAAFLGLLKDQTADDQKEVAIRAPINGTISKIQVQEGDEVQKGDVLLFIVAMKMENPVVAGSSGKIARLHVKAGESVSSQHLLMELQ